MKQRSTISVGDVFGRWSVISLDTEMRWHALCRCQCGTVREVRKASLNNGQSSSCGCVRVEKFVNQNTKHSQANRSDPVYNAWSSMLSRCINKNHPSFRNYGGRGITVCDEWVGDFVKFSQDMGARPMDGTLERIDTNSGYSKENCRWATQSEQCKNTRHSKRWHVNGSVFSSLSEASSSLGVSVQTVMGWCDGYTVSGKHYPARNNCWSEKVYASADVLKTYANREELEEVVQRVMGFV